MGESAVNGKNIPGVSKTGTREYLFERIVCGGKTVTNLLVKIGPPKEENPQKKKGVSEKR